ncbi:MAG: hypothetical protein QM743_04675 [Chitinophagaceae bacterium]
MRQPSGNGRGSSNSSRNYSSNRGGSNSNQERRYNDNDDNYDREEDYHQDSYDDQDDYEDDDYDQHDEYDEYDDEDYDDDDYEDDDYDDEDEDDEDYDDEDYDDEDYDDEDYDDEDYDDNRGGRSGRGHGNGGGRGFAGMDRDEVRRIAVKAVAHHMAAVVAVLLPPLLHVADAADLLRCFLRSESSRGGGDHPVAGILHLPAVAVNATAEAVVLRAWIVKKFAVQLPKVVVHRMAADVVILFFRQPFSGFFLFTRWQLGGGSSRGNSSRGGNNSSGTWFFFITRRYDVFRSQREVVLQASRKQLITRR